MIGVDNAHTVRTVLRRPSLDDLDAVYRIHSDPATNKFNPAGPDPDRDSSEIRLREWLDHWNTHEFGYWTVVVDGAIAGFAGLRHTTWLDRDVLNLYYRFAPEFWGRGFATEVARYAVGAGVQAFPETPILARTKDDNEPSKRTAIQAGLTRRADLDRDDGTGIAVIFVSSWPSPVEDTAIAEVHVLERELQTAECRRDATRVRTLLADDFTEIGASGKVWDRRSTLELLDSESSNESSNESGSDDTIEVHNLTGRKLDDRYVLAQWDSRRGVRRARRTSLWRRTQTGWELVHHQGTALLG